MKLEPPLAYLITIRTYGTWLHGDDRGSDDRDHNQWDTPYLPPDQERRNIAASRLKGNPAVLTWEERQVVDAEVRSQCAFRDWRLWALNVRTEHVHVVVSSAEAPERVMNILKSYATRALRAEGRRPGQVWSRHGSTRYLWEQEALAAACVYVVEGQDEPHRDR